MLLQRLQSPPSVEEESNYISELKCDGIRLMMSNIEGKTRLYTRHGNEVTAMFPEITSIPIPPGTILDGELIALSHDGMIDFELMMQRFMSKKLINKVNIQYVVFDILYSGNHRITALPLLERKKHLLNCLPSKQKTMVPVQYMTGHCQAFYDAVKAKDLEGIVIKRINSTYTSGRVSKDWLKIINYKYKVVYITSIQTKKFGCTLTDENGQYLGTMEYMPGADRKHLFSHAQIRDKSEKGTYLKLIEPIPCKVKFRNWTKENLLRLPSFEAWVN